MANSFNSNIGKVYFLTKKSVIDLHKLLSENTYLLEKMNPGDLKGLKDVRVLESTVARQTTCFGKIFKYPDCFSNCASLIYGIMKNDSFHNENKSLGFLSLIKHLYDNGYVLNPQLNSEELFDFLMSIADSKIQQFNLKYKKRYKFIRNNKEKKQNPTWDVDTNIEYMAFWIQKNSSAKQDLLKGDIKISDLKKTLETKKIFLEKYNSSIEVFIEKENNLLGFKLVPKKKNAKKYPIENNSNTIEKEALNELREDFNLTKSDGIENTFFYNEKSFLDSEMKTYKKLICRLSETKKTA